MKDARLTELANKIYTSELFTSSTENCTLNEKQNIFLIAGGVKPVGFVSSCHKKDLGEGAYEYEADDADFVVKFLSSLGLFSRAFGDKHTTDAIISLKEEYLLQLDSKADDHRLAGKLYGYPDTAVEAFLIPNKADILEDDEQDQVLLTAGIPICFPAFKMSISHWHEELPIVQKWYNFCKLYGLV